MFNLNSVMEQTFKDYEAILIDDGSCDDSAEFCDEFCKKDDRFVVIHQENKGVSCARNKGLEQSQGKYVCFIDSDDYVKEEYLETLITSISEENADLS